MYTYLNIYMYFKFDYIQTQSKVPGMCPMIIASMFLFEKSIKLFHYYLSSRGHLALLNLRWLAYYVIQG